MFALTAVHCFEQLLSPKQPVHTSQPFRAYQRTKVRWWTLIRTLGVGFLPHALSCATLFGRLAVVFQRGLAARLTDLSLQPASLMDARMSARGLLSPRGVHYAR